MRPHRRAAAAVVTDAVVPAAPTTRIVTLPEPGGPGAAPLVLLATARSLLEVDRPVDLIAALTAPTELELLDLVPLAASAPIAERLREGFRRKLTPRAGHLLTVVRCRVDRNALVAPLLERGLELLASSFYGHDVRLGADGKLDAVVLTRETTKVRRTLVYPCLWAPDGRPTLDRSRGVVTAEVVLPDVLEALRA